jgi:hypothetical protein
LKVEHAKMEQSIYNVVINVRLSVRLNKTRTKNNIVMKKRSKSITLRITEKEYLQIKRKSKGNVSDYIRTKLSTK